MQTHNEILHLKHHVALLSFFQFISIQNNFLRAAGLILPFPRYSDEVGTLVCGLPLAPDFKSLIPGLGPFQCTQILKKRTQLPGLPGELFPTLRKFPKIPTHLLALEV